jgi:micrococcal nuclease
MRKKSRIAPRPGNVRQFRGHSPRPGLPRTRRRGTPRALLALSGLVAGVLLGTALVTWMEAGWPVPAIASAARDAETVPGLCVASVHDGDTVRTCGSERIRIENIDAPELPGSPKCTDRRRQGWCDHALAERSRAALASFLASGPVAISRSGTDRYGRTLARLSVNGEDAGEHLVALGLARPWM